MDKYLVLIIIIFLLAIYVYYSVQNLKHKDKVKEPNPYRRGDEKKKELLFTHLKGCDAIEADAQTHLNMLTNGGGINLVLGTDDSGNWKALPYSPTTGNIIV